jgi:hypothetical protein
VEEISFSPTASNILAALTKQGTLYVWNLDKVQQDQVQHISEPDFLQGLFSHPMVS